MPRAPKGDRKARSIALSGMLGAVAVLIMMMGGIIPIATFTAPMLAGLCLVPVMIETGPKTALIAYGAVSLLSLFLVADREMSFFYILLLGYYPILQDVLNRIPAKPLRFLCKLAILNLAVVLIYILLLFVFTSPELVEEFSGTAWWFWAAMLGIGNITFLLYDVALLRVKYIYYARFKGKFFR